MRLALSPLPLNYWPYLCPQYSKSNNTLIVLFLSLLCRQLQPTNQIDLTTPLQLAALTTENADGPVKTWNQLAHAQTTDKTHTRPNSWLMEKVEPSANSLALLTAGSQSNTCRLILGKATRDCGDGGGEEGGGKGRGERGGGEERRKGRVNA